jgi:hypothetical protein
LLAKLYLNPPVDTGNAGNVLLVADALREQPVPDLPGEHGGVLLLVLADSVHHRGCGHLGLAPADDARLEVPGLVIPAR